MRAFDRPQTPTTQSHCWHLRHNGGWPRQRERARNDTADRSWLRARVAVLRPLSHGVGCVRVVGTVLSLLDGTLKPGPGALSLIKHTRVRAFCNLQVMPFPMILNLAHSLETLDPRVPDPNENGLVGYVDTKLVRIQNIRVLAYKTAD